ncbi:Bromodomain containing protein [Gracilaria domingensis]|nr:Bromodomain containing protein [Gracilaria domingensis]
MTSVHEDVIKDVRKTAVSEAAGQLRKALRLAFENIIDPPKEQSEPMSQPSAQSPVQAQPRRQEAPQETEISFLPTIKEPNAKRENKAEALKQVRPLESLASRAHTNSVQQSERPQTSITDNEIKVPQPTAIRKTSPKYNTPPSMQTIPTYLFQSAHNILELKAKEEAAKASLAANKNRKDEPNQTNSVDDTKRDSYIDPKPMQSPETFAAYDSGREAKVAEIPRKSQIEAKKLKNISDSETMDVEALHDNNATAPTTEQRRGRKRRKPPAKLVVDGVGTRKRRRKSNLQHDACTEVEESGRENEIRRQNNAVANIESERVTEKRSGRKRGKSSEKGIFAERVDLGDEGQSSYLREIKNPMDLGTIANRLKKGAPQQRFVENVNKVLADIKLLW